MDFRTPVIADAPVVFPHLEHAGQGCDAHAFYGLARIQCDIDIHQRGRTRRDFKAICARNARRIEQGIHHQMAGLFRRSLQPEFAETREFFRPVHAAINREATCRQAVLPFTADRAEVTRAQESGNVAHQVGMEVDAETGKAEVFRHVGALQPAFAIVEHGRIVGQLDRLAVFHFMDLDRLVRIHAKVEELDLKTQLVLCP
ncbi:hypothetical protein D3C81_1599910 [compost metagenome]